MRYPFTALALGAALAWAAPAAAEGLLLPESQYGKLDIEPNQSLGGSDAYMRAQGNAAFEPIVDFNPNDLFRKRSLQTARLDLRVQESDRRGWKNCTATLLPNNLILTNYHCIPGRTHKVFESRAVFQYLRQGQKNADAFSVDLNPVAADNGLDFAILRLRGDANARYGALEIRPTRVEPNASLVIYHHPAGMPMRITRYRCRAALGSAYDGATFRHRCDTLGGSSGALIYDTQHRVVALHHSAGLNAQTATSFNRATAIEAILARLNIRPQRQPAPQPQPQPNADNTIPLTPPDKLFANTRRQNTGSRNTGAVMARVPDDISQNKLNVRSGPGLGHGVIGSIPGGASDVRVFRQTCRGSDDGRTKKPWCRIRWGSLDGWASSSGLRM